MSHARAYDYVLGGKDNFAVDREAARQVIALAPDLPALGEAQRRFLLRVTQMCAEEGIKQFLGIGAGIPTAPNVHQSEIERFFDGFELLPPGVVDVQQWWPDESVPPTMLKVAAGVGRRR